MKKTSEKRSRGSQKKQSTSCEVISQKIPYLPLTTITELELLINHLPENPVTVMDLKYTFDKADIYANKNHRYVNCRMIQSRVAAVSFVGPKLGKELSQIVLTFDLEKKKHRWVMKELLYRSSKLIGRNLKYQLLALTKLNLPRPSEIWDIAVANQVLNLDKVSKEALVSKDKTIDDEKIYLPKKYRAWARSDNALSSICLKHSVPFLGYESLEEYQDTSEQYSKSLKRELKDEAARNTWLIKLVYPKQRKEVKSRRLKQLVKNQMPWIALTAEAQWHGLLIDAKKAAKIRRRILSTKGDIVSRLEELEFEEAVNLGNVRDYLIQEGVIRENGQKSEEKTLKDLIESLEINHPIIEPLRHYVDIEKALAQVDKGILSKGFLDEENRTYPEFINLGAVTGRDLTLFPNIFNCPSVLRPLIIAPPGRKLAEIDYGQIDIAVVAGMAGDEALIDAYNSGDVYATIAQTIFKDELPTSAQKMDSHKFKVKYPKHRKIAKKTLFKIMYGSKADKVAENLGIATEETQAIINSLRKTYPTTFEYLEENLERSLGRGYAKSYMGFRRYTNHLFDDQENRKELSNSLINHPIQATSSEVFKAAGIKLNQRLKEYDAHILVPLHDSFLIEAPEKHFERVVRLTERIMKETLTEFFPEINGKVTVNDSHPKCWNKDGKVKIMTELKKRNYIQ